ncbi:MAG TPA: alpha-ketoglutarate-dependent dioxygenase AlkB [Acidimicrobiales bacterium]|nr:alpha-ketoglutarate-dependent dioxygenase AlkB [Acidimicrobiales bacterium]
MTVFTQTVKRVDLGGGSWVDLGKGWLPDGDRLFEQVVANAPWRMGRVFRYEKWVDEPRLGAGARDIPGPAGEALAEARRRLMRHYGVTLSGGGMAYYRDGRDGMAFHRDRDLRYLDDTIVAILTLGGPRPFALRPFRDGFAGGESEGHVVEPGPGDLLVMGGRCQADWQHSVPKQYKLGVPGRISVQWRWTSRTGRPVVGASYRAPRTYRT